MKLNNLDDFTKNNWYITTTASAIIDTRQLKESSSSSSSSSSLPLPPVAIQNQSIAPDIIPEHQYHLIPQQQINNSHKSIDILTKSGSGGGVGDIINNSYSNIEDKFINNYYHNNKKMPATTTATTTDTTTTCTQQSDVLAVEELVYEIKENLRLKARPTSQQNGRSSRPSPYHIPCRSWNDQQQQQQIINNTENHLNCNYINNKNNTLHYHHHHHNHLHHHHHHKKEQDIDDPYELLQTLLKSKNLVKEAVRRLQLNNISSSPKAKKSYFYDSDDESRSPMFRMCQLEL